MNWNTSSTAGASAGANFNESSFSTPNEGGGGAASNSQTRKTSRGTAQNLLPIVIKMIPKTGLEDGLKLYGSPVYMVKIVGFLLECEIETTQAKLKIRDNTGSIKAHFWLDNTNTSSGPSKNLSTLKEGCLVQILGKVGVKDGERSVMVVDIKPVDDANLLVAHLLEVIRTKLLMKSLRRETMQKIRLNNPGANLANSMRQYNQNKTTNVEEFNLTNLQSKIAEILKNASGEMGIDRATILSNFPVARKEEVQNALKFLIQEGHAYTTIDADHFKSTD